MSASGDLAALRGGARSTDIPRPSSRWRTRVLIPAVIVLAIAALVGYAGREAFTPAVDVHVVPVIAVASGGVEGAGGHAPAAAAVQAPGWIEPDPYAVSVPALAEGVVREVLVLEGDRVEAGQVIARLIDDDARVALARADAETAGAEAEEAQADAERKVAEARVAETRRDVERKRPLTTSGGISQAEIEQLDLRLVREEQEIAVARARAAVMAARTRTAAAAREQARLTMSRMELHAPTAGIVLQRLVQPGTRLTISGQDAGDMPTIAARLYDPAHLCVRVDVPLADAARIGVGTRAEITTEALPGRTFNGTVVRLVHEANIQRNTVQVKVRLEAPDAAMRPEMLARVRLFPEAPATSSSGANAGVGAAEVLLIPKSALRMDGAGGAGGATCWIVDQADGRARAALRTLRLSGETADGHVLVDDGLRAGDRVIVGAPPGLRAGDRVRIVGEAKE